MSGPLTELANLIDAQQAVDLGAVDVQEGGTQDLQERLRSCAAMLTDAAGDLSMIMSLVLTNTAISADDVEAELNALGASLERLAGRMKRDGLETTGDE